MPPPGTQQQNKIKQFPVCANVSVLFSWDILSQACEKHIQTRFSLSQFWFLSITQLIMLCHVSVHRVLSNYKDRARDPISVAFLDQVALFSDFHHFDELLGAGFAPYSSSAFYILEWNSKNILKTLTSNFMNNFDVGNAWCSSLSSFVWDTGGGLRRQNLLNSAKYKFSVLVFLYYWLLYARSRFFRRTGWYKLLNLILTWERGRTSTDNNCDFTAMRICCFSSLSNLEEESSTSPICFRFGCQSPNYKEWQKTTNRIRI